MNLFNTLFVVYASGLLQQTIPILDKAALHKNAQNSLGYKYMVFYVTSPHPHLFVNILKLKSNISNNSYAK